MCCAPLYHHHSLSRYGLSEAAWDNPNCTVKQPILQSVAARHDFAKICRIITLTHAILENSKSTPGGLRGPSTLSPLSCHLVKPAPRVVWRPNYVKRLYQVILISIVCLTKLEFPVIIDFNFNKISISQFCFIYFCEISSFCCVRRDGLNRS